MELPEREQRELAEIEQRLAEDDPQLAARLTNSPPTWFRLSRRALTVLGLLATYVVGLVVIVAGVTTSSAVLIGLGTVITASFPSAMTVQAWRERRR